MEVFTDGACSGSPGPGGWAWITENGCSYGSGSDPSTTNQRMEMRAVLEACLTLDLDQGLVIVSDSAYVVNCFKDKWYESWDLEAGKKLKTGEKLLNADLWLPLIDVVLHGNVRFRKVRGHSGDPMNDAVDALAVAAKKSIMQ